MPGIDLLLTADYEVWGDGSGRVDNCLTEPAGRMMEIAEHHKAVITFFMDVCEYWAFEEAELNGSLGADYRPATMMKEQLTEAVRRGHDVQLHFHPQWLDARPGLNGEWQLDFRYWRLPLLGEGVSARWDIGKLFSRGCETLESLFKPVKSDYRVTSFRAGAWCIQPESKILQAMGMNGILIDSTVIPGKKKDDGRTIYDFTDCCRKPYWEAGAKVTEEGKSGIFEVPITSVSSGIHNRILFKILRAGRGSGLLPERRPAAKVSGIAKLSDKISDLINTNILMLNFSDGASLSELKYITGKAIRQ